MTRQKQQPRRSVFSADAHPLKPDETLAQPEQIQQEDNEATNGHQSPSKSSNSSKSVQSTQKPQETSPKVKATFYGKRDELDRVREAFTRNRLDEGYESLSDFILQSVLKETKRLEKKYNNGEPYSGLAHLPAGRPMRF